MIIIMLYVLLGVAAVVLGVVFYLRAVGSRKYYCCGQCGERFRVELMTAQRCNVCGAPIRHHMRENT